MLLKYIFTIKLWSVFIFKNLYDSVVFVQPRYRLGKIARFFQNLPYSVRHIFWMLYGSFQAMEKTLDV